MSTPRKQILAIGLNAGVGQQHAELTQERIMETMKEELKKLDQANFELSHHSVDPTLPLETLISEAKKQFQSKPWDGITIGNGVRGNPDFTNIFEKLVNLAIQHAKTADGVPLRMAFPLLPSDVTAAVLRVFPETKTA